MRGTKHIPVLLNELINALNLKNGMTVVDATLGGGGHTAEIAKRIFPDGKLIAIDADEEAVRRFSERVSNDVILATAREKELLEVAHTNFSEIETAVGIASADVIIADLGFSSDQVESGSRGFSFRENGPLDMRLDRRTKLTARDVVNGYSEEQLIHIFREYGEERDAKRIARALCDRRSDRYFETTSELADCITASVPRRRAFGGIHPATKVFQAIRMEVNDELGMLKRFLDSSMKVLRKGGVIAVITFHSGEDRIVKEFFRHQSKGCVCPPNFPECRCGRAPALRLQRPSFIRPSAEELARNSRARSAKLRVAEKL